MSKPAYKPGDSFAFKYPFILDEYIAPLDDPEGGVAALGESWRPGVRHVPCGPYGEDSEAVADGDGKQIISIVSTHKPGRFPMRVFYTRQWQSPDGRTFGKSGLHIKGIAAFRQLVDGYQFEYRIAELKKEKP